MLQGTGDSEDIGGEILGGDITFFYNFTLIGIQKPLLT
jgi:hypothetical protein